MKFKTTALCVALLPGLAMLAACNKDHADATNADDMVPPAATAPADSMPADSTATDSMSNDSMADDSMADDSMPADSMSADGMVGDAMSDDGKSFADLDKNGDGGISKDELKAGDMLYDHFSVADADGNGMLSQAEVTEHRADMKAPKN